MQQSTPVQTCLAYQQFEQRVSIPIDTRTSILLALRAPRLYPPRRRHAPTRHACAACRVCRTCAVAMRRAAAPAAGAPVLCAPVLSCGLCVRACRRRAPAGEGRAEGVARRQRRRHVAPPGPPGGGGGSVGAGAGAVGPRSQARPLGHSQPPTCPAPLSSSAPTGPGRPWKASGQQDATASWTADATAGCTLRVAMRSGGVAIRLAHNEPCPPSASLEI